MVSFNPVPGLVTSAKWASRKVSMEMDVSLSSSTHCWTVSGIIMSVTNRHNNSVRVVRIQFWDWLNLEKKGTQLLDRGFTFGGLIS